MTMLTFLNVATFLIIIYYNEKAALQVSNTGIKRGLTRLNIAPIDQLNTACAISLPAGSCISPGFGLE